MKIGDLVMIQTYRNSGDIEAIGIRSNHNGPGNNKLEYDPYCATIRNKPYDSI